MAEIIWTEMAVEDLDSIAEYIARDSEYYAVDFVKRIILEIEKLKEFPLAGRKVPEQNDDNIREIIYHNYRLVYKFESEKIYISIISHGSYDLSDKLENL